MSQQRQSKRKLWTIVKVLVSVALIGGAVAYLFRGSLGESLVYDRTVDQLATERAELAGERLRVGGKLVPNSLTVPEGTTTHEFSLRGESEVVQVRYNGLWPDAATEGREVMVEGQLGADGVIQAERVLARCPSRYKRRVNGETYTVSAENN